MLNNMLCGYFLLWPVVGVGGFPCCLVVHFTNECTVIYSFPDDSLVGL